MPGGGARKRRLLSKSHSATAPDLNSSGVKPIYCRWSWVVVSLSYVLLQRSLTFLLKEMSITFWNYLEQKVILTLVRLLA
ncbi:MAG: hypothetical protein ACI8ZB_003306 [Desulforhopalus sp.]|jgi:hypothetical protein